VLSGVGRSGVGFETIPSRILPEPVSAFGMCVQSNDARDATRIRTCLLEWWAAAAAACEQAAGEHRGRDGRVRCLPWPIPPRQFRAGTATHDSGAVARPARTRDRRLTGRVRPADRQIVLSDRQRTDGAARMASARGSGSASPVVISPVRSLTAPESGEKSGARLRPALRPHRVTSFSSLGPTCRRLGGDDAEGCCACGEGCW
jgi:hypothetical protein